MDIKQIFRMSPEQQVVTAQQNSGFLRLG